MSRVSQKQLTRILLAGVSIYLLVGLSLYLFQTRLIFQPTTLPAGHVFQFEDPFEEQTLYTPDSIALNSLLFKTVDPEGVVLYLHGNGGSLREWGQQARLFLEEGYDVFFLDYRGYGKSGGKIENEEQFYSDIQLGYEHLREIYNEDQIVVLGYSIATAAAARIAAGNHPKKLILKAPYYDFRDLLKAHPLGKITRIYPSALVQFEFPTCRYLEKCIVPVAIFHGEDDRIIPPSSSQKLLPFLKPGDQYLLLPEAGHNNISDHPMYREAIRDLLE